MTTNEMTGGEALVRMLLAHGAGRCSGWAASSFCPSTTPRGGWA
jgi:hypothetical protein